jgi:hypothetical protein
MGADTTSYEFKSPTASNRKTILGKIKRAVEQGKENFVLDLSRSAMPLRDARDPAQYAVDTYAGLEQIRLIGRDTPSGRPLDETIRKGGR